MATVTPDGPLVVGEIPAEPPGFQPRSSLMAALESCGSPGHVVVLTAAAGMCGVGRTQLAAACARARLAEGWPLVVWIDAQHIDGVLGTLLNVHRTLGLSSAADERRAGIAVREWLEARQEPCLIVFDDVRDPGLVRPFVPVAGQAQVVITSDRASAASLGTVLRVAAFSTAEATAFLASRSGLDDEAGARAVAAELGNLPLALAHAAAVIRNRSLGYGVYLEQLRSRPIWRSPVAAPHGTCRRAAEAAEAAVLRSWEAVRDDDQTGTLKPLMELLSVLSPSRVPASLLRSAGRVGLLDGKGAYPETVDRALGRLVATSLLAFRVNGSCVSAHPLVVRVIRTKQAAAGTLARTCESAASLLDSRAAGLWPDRYSNRPAVRDLVQQITALHTAASRCPDSEALSRAVVRLRWWAVTLLNELGDSPAQAILAARRLMADQQRSLGADHPDALAACDNLAATYRIARRAEEAIVLHEWTLAARERVLGPDDPDTLASRNNLALAYRSVGRAGEAIVLHERTLAARERVLGPDHPDTLASRNNLALAHRSAGRIGEAIVLHEWTLAARERVLGPDNPSTLASRENLARAYRSAGQKARAARLERQARATRGQGAAGKEGTRPQPLSSTVDNVVISLAMRGMTYSKVAAYLSDRHGIEVSAHSIHSIVDRAKDGFPEWQSRPLEPAYAVVFFDNVELEIGTDRVVRRTFYLALGVTLAGERDFLGVWVGRNDEGEAARFWSQVLSEIKSRGARAASLVVEDGVQGLPEAVRGAWPQAVLSASIAHVLSSSALRRAAFAPKRDYREMARDMKAVYLADSEPEAAELLADISWKWHRRYPAVVRSWRNSWPDLLSFLRLDQQIRSLITTNAIGSLGTEFSRAAKAGRRFPTELAALRHLYLAVTSLDCTGRTRERWIGRWKPALKAFDGGPRVAHGAGSTA